MRVAISLILIFGSIPSWASTSPSVSSSKIRALEDRVAELEKRQQDVVVLPPENAGPVHSFFKDDLYFGGFFEPAYSILAGPNTDFQAAEVESILGLNISATFTDRLQFVSQFITALTLPTVNEHNDPRAAAIGLTSKRTFGSYYFGALIAQGFIEYRVSDHFKLQGGMGYVPFGYSFQQREPVLFERRGGPQMIRTNPLVNPLWSGFNIEGFYSLSGGRAWGYNVYTFSPVLNPQYPGMGGRIWWAEKDDDFKIGASTQVSKLGVVTAEAVGTDLQVKVKSFSVISELVHDFVHGGDDPWSVYIEPSYKVYRESVIVYVFGDYAESPLNQTGAGLGKIAFYDPYKKWEYGTGVNWLPTSYVRLRLGLTYNDYVGATASPSGQNRDYLAVDLSAGITF